MLLDRSAGLTSSFEAAVRSNVAAKGNRGSDFFLQKLLIEVARAPDIDCILVVRNDGKILADTGP